MEFLTLLSFLVLTFMVFKLLRKKSKTTNNHSHHNLLPVPGPRKLPLIGNLHNVIGNSPLHHIFTNLAAKYGPLMHLQLGEIAFIFVSSVDVAEQVFKTQDQTFSDRPDLGFTARVVTYNCTNLVLAPYGDYWRYLRKICTLELLSMRRVKSFRPIREEENLNMCKWIASNAGSPVSLSERVYLSTFDITTRTSVGKKAENQESVTTAIKEAMKLGSGLTIADIYPSVKWIPLITGMKAKIERIFGHTDGILQSVINQHRAANAVKNDDDATERSEDLADILLKFQEDGSEMPLTTSNIKAVLMDMFVAGAETSTTAVDWSMSEMVKNPHTLKKAQEEVRQVFDSKGYVDETEFDKLKYLKLVIKEAMRLHPPLPLLVPRQNSQRCEINGFEIPAKSRVLVNAWALGRDPKYWKDADKFIPERFLNSSIDFKGNNLEYIPFGAGRRICPGMTFGLANAEFPLAMLLYHFDWEMPNGMKNEELDMTENFGTSLKRKHDLIMIPTVKRPLVAAA